MKMAWWMALAGGVAVYTLAQKKKAAQTAGAAAAQQGNLQQLIDDDSIGDIGSWFSSVGVALGIYGEKLHVREVYKLAQKVIKEHGFKTTPLFLTAIAYKESYHSKGYVYTTGRSRYEAHLKDTSYGIMQTLLDNNARFTYGLGWKAKGYPTPASLADPENSIYQGAAFWEWLRKAYPNRDENWYLRYYNGGKVSADNKTATTVAYAAAVQKNKTEIAALV